MKSIEDVLASNQEKKEKMQQMWSCYLLPAVESYLDENIEDLKNKRETTLSIHKIVKKARFFSPYYPFFFESEYLGGKEFNEYIVTFIKAVYGKKWHITLVTKKYLFLFKKQFLIFKAKDEQAN